MTPHIPKTATRLWRESTPWRVSVIVGCASTTMMIVAPAKSPAPPPSQQQPAASGATYTPLPNQTTTSLPASPFTTGIDTKPEAEPLLRRQAQTSDGLKIEPGTSGESVIKMTEGWIARSHLQQTEDFLDIKRPILKTLQEEPLNTFPIKEASFPLSVLSDGSWNLSQAQIYGYTLQGYFKAEKEGKYGFGVEATANSVPKEGVHNYISAKCFTSLKIEGQTVLQQEGSIGRDNNKFMSIAATKSVSLSPGIYQVEATINCNPQAYYRGFGSVWSMKVRQPDATELTVPKDGFVMHKLTQS